MAGWKKLLLGAVIVASGLLIVIVLLVKIYITPERVHELVRSGLESSLQRKVSLGPVEVGLLAGIKLEKLSIQSRDEKNLLLSAENITLTYDFMALLRGELLFGHILIKEPQLRLVREVDGRLNIDDLFGGQSVVNEASTSGAGVSKHEPAGAIPLLVKKISLTGGTLQFIDRKLNQHSPYRYRLEKLDVNVENFSLETPFPVRLAANLNDSPFAIELLFDVADGLQTLQLHLNQLNLVPFLPYFQNVLPGSLGQGLLSTELKISRQPEGFLINGQVVVDQLDIRIGQDKPIQWNEVRIALDQEVLYRISDQVVEVQKFNVDLNGVQASYQGKVLLAKPAQVAGKGSLKVVDLREISALIPLELREQVAAYAVAGSLDATLQIQGAPVSLDVVSQATIKLSELQASIGEIRPALTGTFNYAEGRIQGDRMKIDLNDQLLLADLKASKKIASLPYLELLISGEKLNLDALFPPKKETAPPDAVTSAGKTATGNAKTTQKPPLTFPFDGRVTVQLSQLISQGLHFEKVQGDAVVQKGTLALENITAGVAGGVAKLTAAAELSKAKIPFRGHLSLSGIDLSRLTTALLPEAQGSISGTLIAESDFSGHGGSDDISTDLNAQGSFDLNNGEIKGSPLLAGFSQFLGNPELEVLGFSRFYGQYGIKGRLGTIDALLESRRVLLGPQGSFSLDGPLNILLNTRISPNFMAKSGVGGKGLDLLKDENGWSLLPLKVKGDYSKPRFILDSSGIKKQLEKGLTTELGRQLQKKLGGAAEDQSNQQIQQLLDGTLKKLFGN